MVYITIPSLSSFSSEGRLAGGALDPRRNDMRSLLERYSVREVTLVRRGFPSGRGTFSLIQKKLRPALVQRAEEIELV